MLRALVFWMCALCATGAAWAQAAPAAAPPASAPAPASPYSATVPVAGTSDAQRAAAISAALAEVLQAVSPGFAAPPATLAAASTYVRRYRYQRAPSGTGLVLTVDFDPGAVGRLVNAAAGGATPAAAVAVGAAPAAAGSAGPAATVASGGPATIWIGGIDDSHAFATVLSALRGASDLSQVRPVAASGDGVLVSVVAGVPLATVLQSLAGPTGHLAMAAQPHAGADASLQWLP